jgi:type III secretion protein R
MNQFDPVVLAFTLALLALVPMAVVISTTFLKLAIVMSLLRNALGIQQIPPNIALYSLALILTLYIMAPVGDRMLEAFRAEPKATQNLESLIGAVRKGAEPLRGFLLKNSKGEQRDFFVRTSKRLWTEEMSSNVRQDDFLVLIPAFVVTELTSAFQIGFLLYLPFVVIDLVISNILLAMGMMMVSPVTISLPLKLFLFVLVDGWTRLIQGLVLSYV